MSTVTGVSSLRRECKMAPPISRLSAMGFRSMCKQSSSNVSATAFNRLSARRTSKCVAIFAERERIHGVGAAAPMPEYCSDNRYAVNSMLR
jgi:hypothetical protein